MLRESDISYSFYRQISQYLNMVQNSFGHTIERRCRCESRTIRNKEFVQIGLFGGLFWGGDMVFPSYIFIYRSGTELFTFYHLPLEVGKKGYGEMCQELFVWDYFRF